MTKRQKRPADHPQTIVLPPQKLTATLIVDKVRLGKETSDQEDTISSRPNISIEKQANGLLARIAKEIGISIDRLCKRSGIKIFVSTTPAQLKVQTTIDLKTSDKEIKIRKTDAPSEIILALRAEIEKVRIEE